LDIEVAFKIVVFCLFSDFSKSPQSNWDFAVLSPVWPPCIGGNKTNMGASEIDLTGVRHAIEIRRVVKACAGKIGSLLERSSRKISFALESRVCKRNVYERSTLPVECDAPYEAGLVKFGLGTE